MDNGESQLTGDCSLLEDSNGGVPPLVVPVITLESSDENGNSSEAEVCVFVRGDIYIKLPYFRDHKAHRIKRRSHN